MEKLDCLCQQIHLNSISNESHHCDKSSGLYNTESQHKIAKLEPFLCDHSPTVGIWWSRGSTKSIKALFSNCQLNFS